MNKSLIYRNFSFTNCFLKRNSISSLKFSSKTYSRFFVHHSKRNFVTQKRFVFHNSSKLYSEIIEKNENNQFDEMNENDDQVDVEQSSIHGKTFFCKNTIE